MEPKKTYRQQMRKVNGRMYGPYWYSEWREGGRIRTAYHGKERPADAQAVAELPQPPAYDLYDGDGRTRECWLFLGYPSNVPHPDRETVRRRVWNMLAAKSRPAEQKAEIRSAWEHLCYTVWPERKPRPAKAKGASNAD